MLQASADWGKTAPARRRPLLAAAARLDGGRLATSPVGGGDLQLLAPLPLTGVESPARPLSGSLVWNLRRVVCYGVVRAAPWRLSDALITMAGIVKF